MAPRQGQLDDISVMLGELRASVKGIEKYMHDREHGLRNLSQEVKGMSVQFSKELAAAKGEINAGLSTALQKVEASIEIIDGRVTALERTKEQERGAKTALMVILQSPLLAWLVAAAVLVATWWKGQGR
jgi:hypothetical protein